MKVLFLVVKYSISNLHQEEGDEGGISSRERYCGEVADSKGRVLDAVTAEWFENASVVFDFVEAKRRIGDGEKLVTKRKLKAHDDSRADELKKKRIGKRKTTAGGEAITMKKPEDGSRSIKVRFDTSSESAERPSSACQFISDLVSTELVFSLSWLLLRDVQGSFRLLSFSLVICSCPHLLLILATDLVHRRLLFCSELACSLHQDIAGSELFPAGYFFHYRDLLPSTSVRLLRDRQTSHIYHTASCLIQLDQIFRSGFLFSMLAFFGSSWFMSIWFFLDQLGSSVLIKSHCDACLFSWSIQKPHPNISKHTFLSLVD
ncbi:hypothetical protein F511_33272 [Dorcoceras hygrometricum]|uniref:Uncharacterized protein n=1 Tax=Dorcoceras hygrometricum TaxID=472368 RepID=A0A2Z7CKB2_9LAMI|nr:hypothetical protein F511_33272 [Dorcoceras hygrometricum]